MKMNEYMLANVAEIAGIDDVLNIKTIEVTNNQILISYTDKKGTDRAKAIDLDKVKFSLNGVIDTVKTVDFTDKVITINKGLDSELVSNIEKFTFKLNDDEADNLQLIANDNTSDGGRVLRGLKVDDQTVIVTASNLDISASDGQHSNNDVISLFFQSATSPDSTDLSELMITDSSYNHERYMMTKYLKPTDVTDVNQLFTPSIVDITENMANLPTGVTNGVIRTTNNQSNPFQEIFTHTYNLNDYYFRSYDQGSYNNWSKVTATNTL